MVRHSEGNFRNTSFDHELKTFLAIDEVAQASAEINKPLTGQKLSRDMNCSALPLVGNYYVTTLVSWRELPSLF